jgi:hypothetical protein
MNLNRKIISVFIFCWLIGSAGFSFAQNQTDEKVLLKILIKPRPVLSDEQREMNFCAQGVVRLRIEFLANGEIGTVTPLNSLPYGLTENAVEAAKKIRFKPETRNNQPINKFKVIEYSFYLGWNDDSPKDEKAEAVIKKAVEKLGGQKYLQAKNQFSTGNFTLLAAGQMQQPNPFVDALVFPDKERTEFRQSGGKVVQTNTGKTGWIYDGATKNIRAQTESEIEDFERGQRTSLDNLLRGNWRGKAALAYGGRRQASIGKRNDVVRLTYADGFVVEYEFADNGLPVKAVYKRRNANTGEDQKEEDRYAQFIEFQGILTPLVVDHFIKDEHASRINYEKVEFNKNIPDSIFKQPASPKEVKELRF